ncbi:unnamed protein product [Rotaria sp. Silwood1]|nr:unnamed protein product [Rotaria sp. Silwood1]
MIMKFSSISVPKSASNGNNTEPSERPNIHLPIIIRQAPSPPPLPFIQLFFQIKEDFKNEKKHQEDITKLTNEISPLKEDFKNEKKYQEDIAKLTNENQELQKKLVVIPQSNTPGINNYLRIMESMGFFNSN